MEQYGIVYDGEIRNFEPKGNGIIKAIDTNETVAHGLWEKGNLKNGYKKKNVTVFCNLENKIPEGYQGSIENWQPDG